MKQPNAIDVDRVSSFDDLLQDLEAVKNAMKGPTTRAGTSVSIIIDENIIFQYLEEARDDFDRVKTVCNRLRNGASNQHSKRKKQKLVPSVAFEDLGSSVSRDSPGIVPGNRLQDDPGLDMFHSTSSPDYLLPPDSMADSLPPDPVLSHLREMFPQLPVEYLKEKARNKSPEDIQSLVETILTGEDPHDDSGVLIDGANISAVDRYNGLHEIDLGGEVADTSLIDEDSTMPPTSEEGEVTQSYQTLLHIFPDVDPEFLQHQSSSIGADSEKLETFIAAALENKSSFPSRKQYQQRKTKLDEQFKIRLLTVRDFLQMWDDPHAHFSDISSAVSDLYKEHSLFQLRKSFPSLHQTHIVQALEESNYHYVPALKKIQNLPPKRGKKKQAPVPARPQEMDLTFLKEYIYSKLESKIRRHQAAMEEKHNVAVEEARKNGGLFDCQCCFDGDCLLTEVVMCEEGHMFCKDCLRRGAAVQIGDQKSQISCLLDCGSFFSLPVLQDNLSPTIFSRLLQKRQLEEVTSAGLEDLVQCPACNFATIMPDPLDKVVRCKNPECGKESCRLCQEDNHIPLTCDEVEKDSDVADRVKLENAMSEAMIRTCVACKKKFFKEEGCNMMKCTCGAKMCYICREPVKDYSHFDGPNACPSTSDNLNLHKYEVLEAASKAKKELNKTVKYDPTKAIDMPPEGFNPQAMNFGNPFIQAIQAMRGRNPFPGFHPQVRINGNPVPGFDPQALNGGYPFQFVNGGNPVPGFDPQAAIGQNIFQDFHPQAPDGGNPLPDFDPQALDAGNPVPGFHPQVLNGGNPVPGFDPQALNGGNPFQDFRPQAMDGGNPVPGFDPQALDGGTPVPGFNPQAANGLNPLQAFLNTRARRRLEQIERRDARLAGAREAILRVEGRVRRGRRSRWQRQPRDANPIVTPEDIGAGVPPGREAMIVPQEVPPAVLQQSLKDEVIIVDDDSDLDAS